MATSSTTAHTATWQCLQHWWNAVDTAGFGFYAAASQTLATVMADAQQLFAPDRYIVTALCSATQASWERQAGRHSAAAALDEQALQLVRRELPREEGGMAPDTAEYLQLLALADATTGRAADALGNHVEGDPQQLIQQGDEVLAAVQDCDFPAELTALLQTDLDNAVWGYCGLHAVRAVIRHSWVNAEVAMSVGEWERAQTFATQAVELSSQWFSPRHQVKSLLVEAAATSGTDPQLARKKALLAFENARATKFLPLEWAAAMLLASLPGDDISHWEEQIAQLREQLNQRGACYPE